MKAEGMNLRWDYGDRTFSLPPFLVEKQGLNQEQVDDVKALQLNRARIEAAIKVLDPVVNLNMIKIMFSEWQINEGKLQQAWGFEYSPKYWATHRIPHCICPKMDNDERIGTDMQVYVVGCPIHG